MSSKMSTTTTNDRRVCTGCGGYEGAGANAQKHSRCSGCRLSLYCSARCQGDHWHTHKVACRLMAGRGRALIAAGGLPLAVARTRLSGWLTDPFNVTTMTLLANRACHGAPFRNAYVVSLDDERLDVDVASAPESEVVSDTDLALAFADGMLACAHLVVVLRLRGIVVMCPTVPVLPERVWRAEMASLVDEAQVVLLQMGAKAMQSRDVGPPSTPFETSVERAMGASMTEALHPGRVAMLTEQLRANNDPTQ